MPEQGRRRTTAELLTEWLSAEQEALAAEGLAYDAELVAATAERDAVAAERAAEIAFRLLEEAHFRYLQRMDELQHVRGVGTAARRSSPSDETPAG
jgi:hypothetical protein